MIQNTCLKIAGIYVSQKNDVKVLYADASVLILGDYLEFLATNTHESMTFHPNGLVRHLCMEIIYHNSLTCRENHGVYVCKEMGICNNEY
jgi:hypothetical protein